MTFETIVDGRMKYDGRRLGPAHFQLISIVFHRLICNLKMLITNNLYLLLFPNVTPVNQWFVNWYNSKTKSDSSTRVQFLGMGAEPHLWHSVQATLLSRSARRSVANEKMTLSSVVRQCLVTGKKAYCCCPVRWSTLSPNVEKMADKMRQCHIPWCLHYC